jgi:hypothetical protein
VIISPPRSASEAADAISLIAAQAAAGKMDLNDAADLTKLLESFSRTFVAANFEELAEKVRMEVRAELLSVGLERHAEYQVPSAPTPQ